MNLNWNELEKLCNKYGESYYLLDSNLFENNYNEFLAAFRAIYPNTHIGYSYKTNYIPTLCSIINNRNGYAEVVSEMEYDLAIKIGVLPEKIIVNGPYKNKQTIAKFLLNGSIVNLDSYYEVNFIEEIAKENSNSKLSLGIRCNFKINDSFISRFGIDVDNKEFYDIFERFKKFSNVNIKGLHCHFPNRDLDSYVYRVDRILQLTDEIFITPPEYINIGGGYFGKMPNSLEIQFKDKIPSYNEYAEVIATRINNFYKGYENNIKPKLILEPGSALVANTMKFVVKVIEIKKVRSKSIAVVSGSKFNIGLLSSRVYLPMKVYSRSTNNAKNNNYDSIDISGYTCIESDYLFKNYCGPLVVGDFIVFSNVGSYSIVLKPPFIFPNVPIIEHDREKDTYKVIKRKETMNDIFSTFSFCN